MIIRKILNNNVIVTENAAGREIVAMGRGNDGSTVGSGRGANKKNEL